ncbi:MAG: acetolactate synthase large subunit [Nitrosopumilus sp.]|nr:acetolactate synthase large subunit [Nitrosopumilus sp.]MDH3516020.1 acetolactate synthase large subunit [Nitrosopumilus sp.]MDH3565649.1 acetolactate synthase large subunit [Nitrosopumilus sp.]MDH5417281.1 acetolactate synthase large subunit [Nitrosopumilus sp.]MDH5555563.1 acetolactate synthase large subunit [Nitrosopumilus sp.]
MKASDLFVKCLENEGVEYIFGIPGEENADFMMSLSESKIKFILTRHEQGAAFMADVYGRLTGKVGVCLATLGPGATNLVTGVANANMDRSRLLAITGQTDSHLLHKESHQNMDAITLFKPITKWNWSIRNPQNIPEIVRRAFKISLEEKPGATHIELPQDIAKKDADIPPIEPQPVFRSEPNEQLIKQAVKIILEAKNPVIFLGNGCVRENASPHIRKFVEKTGIIAMNTFMGKGVVSDDSPLHLHTIGIKDADHALLAMKSADVVIAVGVDLVEYSPKNWNLDFSKKIIHIDFTPSEVYTYYRPMVEIVSDIGYAVDAILEELELQKKTNPELDAFPRKEIPKLFKKIINEVDERRDSFNHNMAFPIKPEKLVIDVRNALGEKDIVLSDVGAHKLWISKIYKTYQPNTCIIPNGFCSMGFAFPGAIAAKIVHPNRNVVAMCGDAGFLMNIQELETAVRLKLSVITIVWCDCDLGMISMKQKNEFGKSVFTKFTNPDFIKLAESFGAVGFVVKSTKDFSKILEDVKKIKDKPVIIAIDVDYSRNNVLLNDSNYENV